MRCPYCRKENVSQGTKCAYCGAAMDISADTIKKETTKANSDIVTFRDFSSLYASKASDEEKIEILKKYETPSNKVDFMVFAGFVSEQLSSINHKSKRLSSSDIVLLAKTYMSYRRVIGLNLSKEDKGEVKNSFQFVDEIVSKLNRSSRALLAFGIIFMIIGGIWALIPVKVALIIGLCVLGFGLILLVFGIIKKRRYKKIVN